MKQIHNDKAIVLNGLIYRRLDDQVRLLVRVETHVEVSRVYQVINTVKSLIHMRQYAAHAAKTNSTSIF